MKRTRSVGALAVIATVIALPLGTASAAIHKITVDSLADTVAADGHCTLREAIDNHNAESKLHADCARGTVKDLVVFTVSGTIPLTSELPAVQHKLIVDGGGAITVDGGSSTRIMETSGNANLALWNITLANGAASGDGGAVLNPNGKLKLDHATLSHNSATGSGGGVYSTGGATIVDSTLDHNSATTAGGLGGIDFVVTRSSFTYNQASQYGGGLYAFALRMTDSTVSNNTAGAGFGGLAASGPGTLVHSTITSNSAPTGGGAVIQVGGGTSFVVNGDAIHGNQAQCSGGGLGTFIADTSSSVLVDKTTIDGNSTTGGVCGGSVGGGGLVPAGPGLLTISNSTIANNSSASPKGGGIYNLGNETLFNVTVSGNAAASAGAGGIYNDSGMGAGGTTFVNTIVAENTAGGDTDCGGTGGFVSNDHNIDSDGTCNLTGSHDQPNTDPQLGPLQNNGGPTDTMAPAPTSPAVDAGRDRVCAAAPVSGRDQRGVARPQGPHCDIGSVELR